MLIKEKIKKQKLHLFNDKNILGHVCVDLHSTYSGFTERVEGDNMITNAVQSILQCAALNDITRPLSLLPIATKLLGGLMIFDGRLELSVTNTMFPGDVHYVGGGGDTTPTESNFIGAYNQIDSHPINNNTGFTTVWDFSTERANGTISSLARTRVETGNFLGGQIYSRPYFYKDSANDNYIYIEDENKILYCNGTQKRSVHINSVPALSAGIVFGDILLVTTNFNLYGEQYWNYSNKTGIAYSTTVANEKTNTIYKYDVKKDLMTSFTGGPDMYSPIVLDDKVIYHVPNRSYYITDLNNLQNSREIVTLPVCLGSDVSQPPIKIGNAILIDRNYGTYWGAAGGAPYLLYKDGTYILLDHNSITGRDHYNIQGRKQGTSLLEDKGLEVSRAEWGTSDPMMLRVALGFLGTIFNLPEPITKTANQTMKITYTLTSV